MYFESNNVADNKNNREPYFRIIPCVLEMLKNKHLFGSDKYYKFELRSGGEYSIPYNNIDGFLKDEFQGKPRSEVELFIKDINEAIERENIEVKKFGANFNSDGTLKEITGDPRIMNSIQTSRNDRSAETPTISHALQNLLVDAKNNSQKGFDGLQNVFKLQADAGRRDIKVTSDKMISPEVLDDLLSTKTSAEIISGFFEE